MIALMLVAFVLPVAAPASRLSLQPLDLEVRSGRWLKDRRATFLGRVDVRNARSAEERALAFVRANVSTGVAPTLKVERVEMTGDDAIVTVGQQIDGLPLDDASAVLLVDDMGVRFARLGLREPPRELAAAALFDPLVAELARSALLAREVIVRKSDLVVHAETNAAAWRVEVRTEAPYGHWLVFVDARDGHIVERRRLAGDAVSGDVRFTVDATCPGDPTAEVAMPNIAWSADQHTDDAGRFSVSDTRTTATVSLESPYFTIVNHAGSLAGPWVFPLAPSPAFNTLQIGNAPLDQVSPFFHAHRVRAWMRGRLETRNSQFAWSEESVTVNVNLPGTCNAFYDGTLNFFSAGGGCNNTGRVATVVYHEYGHGIHAHSSSTFDGQVSEGIADFVAATINNHPQITGLTSCGSAFRSCENRLTYCASGCDLSPGSEVHDAGQVICGVLWELREQLVARYGQDLGVATTERIMLKFLTLVGDMDSTYAAAIAADDDSDNDPFNGTLHSCEINRAFADDTPGAVAHFPSLVGKIPSAPTVTVAHQPPGSIAASPGDAITLDALVSVSRGCATASTAPSVKVVYRVADGENREIAMRADKTDGDSVHYSVTLPDVQAPVTLEYYIVANLSGVDFFYPYQGMKTPRTSQWPYYRQTLRAANDVELYANDFESGDGALQVLADVKVNAPDWEWGTPTGLSGDPTTAASGSHVWGTDLGRDGDGGYTRQGTSALELAPFDASDLSTVRLQFWRSLANADVARIEVSIGDQLIVKVYEQRAGAFYWRDPVWTFQDIDISRVAVGQKDVRIRFVMADAFDDNVQLGGWTIDDVRIVSTSPAPKGAADVKSTGGFVSVSGCSAPPQTLWSALVCLWCISRRKEKR